MKRMPPVPIQALPRVEDRITFLYLDQCVVHRDKGAITARTADGTTYIPAATLTALMLGPGSTVSHQAISLLAECGTTIVWVGDQGVRYYAHGRGLTSSSHLLEAQARASSNRNERLDVARRMYIKRFAGECVDALTMQQLRGREGVRMGRLYRTLADEFGIVWTGRSYDTEDFSRSDPINAAISSANAALYGLVHSVIVALGCSPGLGIVHNGNSRAFVFDIADLYKAEMSLPVAFEAVSESTADLFGEVRRKMRDQMKSRKLISQIVHDIQEVLGVEPELEANVVSLWDYQQGKVSAGTNWGSSWPS